MMPYRKSKMQFKCRHCTKRFRSRQALGGHASKIHPGKSEKNAHKVTVRARRFNERAVHKIAKEIYAEMKAGTLDDLMKHTFRWRRNRKTVAEKEHLLAQ